MRRGLTVSLLLMCAIAAEARVLSYAPLSDQLAERGYQNRATRHFVSIEGRDVVLYDSSGEDAPRVIHSTGSGVEHVALFQERADGAPAILIIESVGGSRRTLLSPDGGASWRQISALDNFYVEPAANTDAGGPWTRGLGAPVQIGNGRYPFVVRYNWPAEVYAIGIDGSVRSLGPAGALLGGNASGTKFLTLHKRTLTVVSPVGVRAERIAAYVAATAGWIADDGIYLIAGHAVYFLRNGVRSLVATGRDLVAIPTHDMNGAWIAHRDRQTTTLLRHRRRYGLERMWSDPDAPAITALHAGRSGQTLLLEAARPRQLCCSRNGVLLARWRIGDPAPRGFDELAGQMESRRGFVHLDVDQVAEGEPFVFYTGLAGGGDVVQEWGLIRGSLRQRLVLQSASRLDGVGGARWRTDVAIYNPLDAPQNVAVRFESATVTLTLAPREIRVATDVLKSLFDVDSGGGPLHFAPDDHVTVNARTYAGAAGYVAPAIDAQNLITPRFPAVFTGAFPGENFRTNLLLLSPDGAELTVGGLPVTVAPDSALQLNGLSAMLGTRNELIVRPTRGSAQASVVAIDNRTNDANWFANDSMAVSADAKVIPFAAHIKRSDGTLVRTDVYVTNLGSDLLGVTLFVRARAPAGKSERKAYLLGANETLLVRDAVGSLGVEGIAEIEVLSRPVRPDQIAAPTTVTSRTYAVDANGGTYGTVVPPLNLFQSAAQGESLELISIAGRELTLSLGLVDRVRASGSGADAVRIHLFDETGRKLDSYLLGIPPGGTTIENLLRGRTAGAVRILIEVLDPELVLAAYLIQTDTRGGDTAYVGANLGGTP